MPAILRNERRGSRIHVASFRVRGNGVKRGAHACHPNPPEDGERSASVLEHCFRTTTSKVAR